MAKRYKTPKSKIAGRPVIMSASGRAMHELSDRALSRYTCAWCGQSLYQMKRSYRNCGSIDLGPCHWYDTLNPKKAAKRQWEAV